MATSRATRITLVTRYLIGRLTCERHEREFCTRPFKITELEKGRWSWISNCSEAFHTDSWLAEANPGHSDRDAILQALLPGPRYGSTLGPGKARMAPSRPTPTKIDNWYASWRCSPETAIINFRPWISQQNGSFSLCRRHMAHPLVDWGLLLLIMHMFQSSGAVERCADRPKKVSKSRKALRKPGVHLGAGRNTWQQAG